MNHETLHAYLDGELNPTERVAVERALADDPALADAYAQLVAVDAAVGTAWELPAAATPGSAELAHEIVARERRARRGRVISLSVAAAGIAAALLLAFLPGVSSPDTEDGFFTDDEQAAYVYWESDGDTYGTGDLSELEAQILDVIGDT